MKKLIFAAVFIVAFAALQPLYAQKISKENESGHYYVSIPLEKVYIHRAGYVLAYRKGVTNMARAYVPYEWFSDAGGKAEVIILPPGQNWPSLTVFYKEGEFSHIKLYVHRWKGHSTWGILPISANIDDRFKDVESIELEF
jgi:hypothetical protein